MAAADGPADEVVDFFLVTTVVVVAVLPEDPERTTSVVTGLK